MAFIEHTNLVATLQIEKNMYICGPKPKVLFKAPATHMANPRVPSTLLMVAVVAVD